MHARYSYLIFHKIGRNATVTLLVVYLSPAITVRVPVVIGCLGLHEWPSRWNSFSMTSSAKRWLSFRRRAGWARAHYPEPLHEKRQKRPASM